MWRAYLADGRVVDHDGDNSPTQFLPLIVRFQVFAPSGAMLAEVEPGPREFVLWRWVRETDGGPTRTVGCKLGVLNRDSGEFDVREWNPETGAWSPTRDLALDEAEQA